MRSSGGASRLALYSRVHLGAEGLLRLVEHHGEVGRPLVRLHLVEQLPQHVAEAQHRVDLQPIGLAGQRRQRVIGAEDVARAVDQEDVVALFQGTGRYGRALHRCSGFGGRGLGPGGLAFRWCLACPECGLGDPVWQRACPQPSSFPRRVCARVISADAPSEKSEGARDAGGPADPRASISRDTRSRTAISAEAAVRILVVQPQVRLLSSVPRAMFEVCSARPPAV